MVGQEGSAVSVGAATGPPETYTRIHITEHSGPLASKRWTVGHLRKRGLLWPQPGSYREAAAPGISLSKSHMKQFLGERRREHTSEVGVKIQAWQMRCFP